VQVLSIGLIAVISVTLSLSACQTGDLFLSPPLKAHIVDSKSGNPIENVKVTMWSSVNPKVVEVGLSDKNGAVELPRLKGPIESSFPLVSDRLNLDAIVKFEANGYSTRQINSTANLPYFVGDAAVTLDLAR
jgi:5-hydroxyisourate hydrolase-like protein (transthyretin family)